MEMIQTPEGPMTLEQAAKRSGLPLHVLANRINSGWPEDKLLAPRGEVLQEDDPCATQ